LIRAGNSAAAVSLGAAILGLALPLAVCMANSVSVYDIVIWGVLTLFIQIAVFWILDHWLKNLPARIEAGEMGAATLLSAVKLSVAMINAAAVSG
jgi:putative membrane protein